MERRLRVAERHAVLRPARPGDRRLDGREVELDDLRVRRLLGRIVPEGVLLAVGLDEREPLGRAPGEAQVLERLVVDGEEATGGAVLRGHVPERRAVGDGEAVEPVAEVLDELPDHARLPQDLRHGQDEVGGGRALGQLAREPEADDLRHEHRDRLAEHRGLGLDPAHAPAEDAEAVDHRRVRVGADERVREGPAAAGLDHAREELEVDLVHDPGVGRDDLDVVERALAPAQEGIALAVPLELELGVPADREPRGEVVHLHGVVDHELGGEERVDLRRVAAEVAHRVAHRGEVDDRGHAGEVLQQDACGREGDLAARLVLRHPGGDCLDVLAGDGDAVLEAEHVLEQDPQRVRQPQHVEAALQRVEPEDLVRLAADGERRAGGERVTGSHRFLVNQRRSSRRAVLCNRLLQAPLRAALWAA